MNPERSWPPIIGFARAPLWVRIRDILLTAAAWARLLYLMRYGLILIIDYFSAPIFKLTRSHSPDWLEAWNRMSTFLILSVVGMLWLLLWGLIHRRRLKFVARLTPPARLPVEQHALAFDLDPAVVSRAHEAKIAVVQFDATHRIASLSPRAPNRIAP
jgi:poly-beta-1,6-N-acetyl-D-glucosamine biosynthesis protein PgaD